MSEDDKGNPFDGKEHRVNNSVQIQWAPDRRTDWQIESTYSIGSIKSAVETYLQAHQEEPWGDILLDRTQTHHTIKGSIINEGELQGIIRLENNNKYLILAVGKTQEGSQQCIVDAELMGNLHKATQTSELVHVPQIYQVIELHHPDTQESITAVAMEYVIGGREVVCSHQNDSPFNYFVVNHTTQEIMDEQKRMGIHIPARTEIDHDSAIQSTAAAKTAVYLTFGSSTKSPLINSGEHMISRTPESETDYQWHLITIRGGLREEKQSLGSFILSLLSHSEKGFYPDSGEQEDTIFPYLYSPGLTLRGIALMCKEMNREQLFRDGLTEAIDTLNQPDIQEIYPELSDHLTYIGIALKRKLDDLDQ